MNTEKLFLALELFRSIYPIMPIQSVQTFLIVASNEGTTSMTDIARQLKMSQGAASRNVAMFLEIQKPGKPGFDFIEYKEDPENRARKLLSLTKKGKSFYEKIVAV